MRQYLGTESLLKMMKNTFHFTLKQLYSYILNSCVILFILNFNMANLLNFKLPETTAVLYNNLYWLSMKLHKSSSSIGFIKKCLYLNVIPKFATLRGKFLSKNERHATERNLLVSHSMKHINDLKQQLALFLKYQN